MQKYPLSEIITSSQYYRTKPDSYVMQKWIKAAIKHLQSRHRRMFWGWVIASILIAGAIIGGSLFYYRYYLPHDTTDLTGLALTGDILLQTGTKTGDVWKREYIDELEDIFARR